MLHKYKMLPLVAVMLVMSLVFSAQAAPVVPDFVPLVQSAGKAVVNISTEKKVMQRGGMPSEMFRGLPPEFERFFEQFEGNSRNAKPRTQRSLGTVFLISSDGYIVTNNHVVAGADTVLVNLQGSTGKEHSLKAQVIGTDEETDIALLKVKADAPLPFLNFGNSDKMEVGEWVLAIGNPFGLDHSVTAGILSAKGRRINAGAFDNFLQTDCAINPGNSGGPLLNMKGEVIGINTAIIASGQGIGFAVPSDLANDIISKLKGGKKISRGWLGVVIQDVDENTAKALDMKDAHGALVASVQEGQPADKAGIKEGDVIVSVDGQNIKDTAELLAAIARKAPGSDAKVTVWREGAAKEFTVKLGDRSENLSAENGIQTRDGSEAKKSEGTLGLSVRPLTRDEAKAFKIKDGGLAILSVDEDKPAAAADLREGDIIVKANMKPVSTVADLTKQVSECTKRGAILLQINRRGDLIFRTVKLGK